MKDKKAISRIIIAVTLSMFGALVLGFDAWSILYGYTLATFIWVFI